MPVTAQQFMIMFAACGLYYVYATSPSKEIPIPQVPTVGDLRTLTPSGWKSATTGLITPWDERPWRSTNDSIDFGRIGIPPTGGPNIINPPRNIWNDPVEILILDDPMYSY